ncbi:MAG: hypothetical protein ABS79_04610 [Planctomycetes bacterium SCN 63-9]|nr:MAG: hypothetical protein ABS79_04610 [Planctomycetes bacterium SCN 63-9]
MFIRRDRSVSVRDIVREGDAPLPAVRLFHALATSDRPERGGSILDKFEERFQLTGPKHISNGRLNLAEDQPASILSRKSMETDEDPEGRRTRKADATHIHDQFGATAIPKMRLIMFPKILHGERVETHAIPELRKENVVLGLDLYRGLEHRGPILQERNGAGSSQFLVARPDGWAADIASYGENVASCWDRISTRPWSPFHLNSSARTTKRMNE